MRNGSGALTAAPSLRSSRGPFRATAPATETRTFTDGSTDTSVGMSLILIFVPFDVGTVSRSNVSALADRDISERTAPGGSDQQGKVL